MKTDAEAAYIPMPKGRGFTPQLIMAESEFALVYQEIIAAIDLALEALDE